MPSFKAKKFCSNSSLKSDAEVVQRLEQDGLKVQKLFVKVLSVLAERRLRVDLCEVMEAELGGRFGAKVDDGKNVDRNVVVVVSAINFERRFEHDVTTVVNAALDLFVEIES